MYKNIQDGVAKGLKIVADASTPEVVNGWENGYPSTPLLVLLLLSWVACTPVILRNNCIVGQG